MCQVPSGTSPKVVWIFCHLNPPLGDAAIIDRQPKTTKNLFMFNVKWLGKVFCRNGGKLNFISIFHIYQIEGCYAEITPPHPIHQKNSHQKGNFLGPFLDGQIYQNSNSHRFYSSPSYFNFWRKSHIWRLLLPKANKWQRCGTLSFRLGFIGLGSTGQGSFGLRSFGFLKLLLHGFKMFHFVP